MLNLLDWSSGGSILNSLEINPRAYALRQRRGELVPRKAIRVIEYDGLTNFFKRDGFELSKMSPELEEDVSRIRRTIGCEDLE